MMKTNTNVNKAKKEKNDEYYTLYDDIRKELINYKSFLKGKKFIVIVIQTKVIL